MATPLGQVYKAAGCKAPATRRLGIEHTARFRQTFDSRHPIFEAPEPARRPKSRKGLLSTVPIDPPDTYPTNQEPSPISQLDWKTWKNLNRPRTGVAPTRTNLGRWGVTDRTDAMCNCEETQAIDHLLVCKNCLPQRFMAS